MWRSDQARMEGRSMRRVTIPKALELSGKKVDKNQVETFFKKAGKAPSIKEQLILKAFEITEETRLLFESEEVILLYSEDHTGVYLSCFNKMQEEVVVTLPLESMKLKGEYVAYCVLTAEEVDILKETLNLHIPDNGILLVKLTKTGK